MTQRFWASVVLALPLLVSTMSAFILDTYSSVVGDQLSIEIHAPTYRQRMPARLDFNASPMGLETQHGQQ